MSRTQLQLEGRDLQELLARVRSEYGDGARIVKAEKVRTGGLAGFFAKESFNVQLEVDTDEAGAPLAGQADDLDDDAPTLSNRPAQVRSILDLADSVSEAERAVPGPRHLISTETAPFADVLARLQREGWDGAAMLATPPPSASGPSMAPRGRAATAAARFEPAPAAEETAPEATIAPTRGAPTHTEPTGIQPAVVESGRTEPAAIEPRVATAPTVDMAASDPEAAPAARATRRARRTVAAPAENADAASTSASTGRLGLPADLVAANGALRQQRLLRWLRSLPVAEMPAYGAGQVLVVFGPAREALDVATRLAAEVGIDAEEVLLATPGTGAGLVPAARRLNDPQRAARRRRREWVDQPFPAVIAVDAGLDLRPASWLRDMTAALAPTTRWGVVHASTRDADIRQWAERLGGVHALAVVGAETTAEPAGVLQLGLPVGLVEGRRSTVEAWAAFLNARASQG